MSTARVSVSQKPTIGECVVKLYAKPSPGSDERVVGTATCAAEGLEPLSVWVGDGLDFSQDDDKGITRLEVSWRAEYTNWLPMPPASFISNAPVQLGITAGSFTVSFGGGGSIFFAVLHF